MTPKIFCAYCGCLVEFVIEPDGTVYVLPCENCVAHMLADFSEDDCNVCATQATTETVS